MFVPASGAAAPKVDVSNSKVTCNTVNATAGVKPTLVLGGTATSVTISIKGILDGCTVTAGNSVIITPGSTFSGKIIGNSNDCGGIIGTNSVGGSLTIKWKADKTTPMLQTSSVVTPGSLTGNLFASSPWGAAYGQFDLGAPGAAVSGAFTGGTGGVNSTVSAITSEDIGAILGQCGTATGVKTLHLGLGQVALG